MNIGEKIVKYRWAIVFTTLLVVLLIIIPLTQIKINSNLESYFSENMVSRQNNDKVRSLFNRSEKVAIIVEADDIFNESLLSAIDNISDGLANSEKFGDVVSVTTVVNFENEDDFLITRPLIEDYDLSDEEKEILKDDIKSNGLVYKSIISEKFDKTLIIAGYDTNVPDSSLVSELESILAQNPIDGKIIYTGLPLLREEANKKISADLALLLPLALLAMLALLTILLGELRSMFLPFSVVIFSTVFAMGLIPLFGWELSIIGVLVPVMMIAIANNYGIYFVSRYREVQLNGDRIRPSGEVASELYNFLSKPVTMCGLTTIAGVMGLMMHILGPIRQMGLIVSLSIAFALVLSLLYIPASISWFNPAKIKKSRRSHRFNIIDKFLRSAASSVISRPKRILVIFISVVLLSLVTIPFIKVVPDSGTILPKKHPFSQGTAILDNSFGGSKYINLAINGEIVDPCLLEKVEFLQSNLESIHGVGAAVSITDILKEIGKALLNPEDSLYGKLPQTREMSAQYLELFMMNASPQELENYVDFDFENALMRVQYSANSMKEAKRLIGEVTKYVEKSGLNITIGGFSLLEYEMNRSVVYGQYSSLLFAFVVIFLLLALIFKNYFAGLIGSLPLFFAVITTLGVMSVLGIELDIVTTLISSVSIGLGVDFTIHLFWRTKSETTKGHTLAQALTLAITNTGKGITINALSVMAGFSVLFASAFPMIRNFALLIILSLFLCLMSALLLIPALSLLIKPKFLTNPNKDIIKDI